jgi:hypothetical protein
MDAAGVIHSNCLPAVECAEKHRIFFFKHLSESSSWRQPCDKYFNAFLEKKFAVALQRSLKDSSHDQFNVPQIVCPILDELSSEICEAAFRDTGIWWRFGYQNGLPISVKGDNVNDRRSTLSSKPTSSVKSAVESGMFDRNASTIQTLGFRFPLTVPMTNNRAAHCKLDYLRSVAREAVVCDSLHMQSSIDMAEYLRYIGFECKLLNQHKQSGSSCGYVSAATIAAIPATFK